MPARPSLLPPAVLHPASAAASSCGDTEDRGAAVVSPLDVVIITLLLYVSGYNNYTFDHSSLEANHIRYLFRYIKMFRAVTFMHNIH